MGYYFYGLGPNRIDLESATRWARERASHAEGEKKETGWDGGWEGKGRGRKQNAVIGAGAGVSRRVASLSAKKPAR